MTAPAREEWFEEWFDSPYYYDLYAKRDYKEAENFIYRLAEEIGLKKGQKVLDAPCGNGRHSKVIADIGADVVGFDLSPRNIELATALDQNIPFFVHDIRYPIPTQNFNFCLNLFTSLGYFDTEAENQVALSHLCDSLNKDGILVIDFLNVQKTLGTLIPKDIVFGQFEYHIKRYIEEEEKSEITGARKQTIVKEIVFEEKGKVKQFQERVRAFHLKDFEMMLAAKNFIIEKIWGSYSLEDFDEERSARLIMKCRASD